MSTRIKSRTKYEWIGSTGLNCALAFTILESTLTVDRKYSFLSKQEWNSHFREVK
jgi:hypothetical protein